MRRCAVLSLLLLLLGLVTSVGVAWVGATRSIADFETGPGHVYGCRNGWAVHDWGGRSGRALLLSPEPLCVDRAWGNFEPPSWSASDRRAAAYEGRLLEDARGWPWLCLYCRWCGLRDAMLGPAEIVTGGLRITFPAPPVAAAGSSPAPVDGEAASIAARRALPVLPIWSGLAASSLFYASVWLCGILLLHAPAALWRWRRRRRGRCARCAYIVSGAPSRECPECGWPIDRRFPVIGAGHVKLALAAVLVISVGACALAAALVSRYEGPPAIHVAARDGDAARLRKLIADGVPVNERLQSDELLYAPLSGTTPLMWAAANGHTEAMRLLLEAGAQVNATASGQPTALMYATRYRQLTAVELLLRSGADIPRYGVFAGSAGELLMTAVGAGHIDLARLLLDRGTDPGPVLAAAVRRSDLEMVRLLIEHGANPGRVDADGATILFHIEWDKAPEDLVHHLFGLGIDVQHVADDGFTVLMAAVCRRDVRAVRALLAAGADPSIRNRDGISALDRAEKRLCVGASGVTESELARGEIVELLLQAVRGPRPTAGLGRADE